MLQVVEYKINKNILTVGFKVSNFVVYSEIPYNKNLTENELLQKAYEQCRNAIEYEKTLDEHSFTTDEEGKEFIPDTPTPTKLIIDFDNLTGIVLDQYGDVYSEDGIEFIIEGTDKAYIIDNKIIEDVVEENVEYIIKAKYGELEEMQDRIIYAPVPDKIGELENQLLEVQNYIVNKEYEDLLREGGM